MNNNIEVKRALSAAKYEIQSLRRRNEILEAKVDVIEIFGAAVRGPQRPMGMAEDVVWTIDKALANIEQDLASPEPPPPPGDEP